MESTPVGRGRGRGGGGRGEEECTCVVDEPQGGHACDFDTNQQSDHLQYDHVVDITLARETKRREQTEERSNRALYFV
jgi:hypothetical protein